MITKGKKALLAALLFALLLIAFALGVLSGMSSKKAENETDIESYKIKAHIQTWRNP